MARPSSAQLVEFIGAYLEALKERLSIIPRADRGLFPEYAFRPFQTLVCLSDQYEGVAFRVFKPIGKPSIIVRRTKLRIEEAIGFPPPIDRGRAINWQNVLWSHLAILVDGASIPFSDRPKGGSSLVTIGGFLDLRGGDDVRFEDVLLQYRQPRRTETVYLRFAWLNTGTPPHGFDPLYARNLGELDATDSMIRIVNTGKWRETSEAAWRVFQGAVESTQREFQLLLRRTDVAESELQEFLEWHPYFLDPNRAALRPQVRFGQYVSDFVIVYSGGTARFVEIEVPQDPCVTAKGWSPRTLHAIRQVESWQSEIDAGKATSPGPPAYPHWVVIGLRARLSREEIVGMDRLNALRDDIKVRCFDELETNLTPFVDELGKALASRLPTADREPAP